MSASWPCVRVPLGDRAYDIVIGHGALAELPRRLGSLAKRKCVYVLTDETVARFHFNPLAALLGQHGYAALHLSLPAGEGTKSFETLGRVLDWLIREGAERSDVLIAFGGGVIGDLGGLAASLMKRGMGFVQVPTTLLAQVDSSVGGKTAVNAPAGKNLIGAFYQPKLVIADTSLLSTLPRLQLAAGYAEIVKYGVINNAGFFDWLEKNGPRVMALDADSVAHAVKVSCQSKAGIVTEDETETGVRQLLNLGHTFGHALEAANQYRDDLVHGEAVAIGMVMALAYSARLRLAPSQDVQALINVLEAAGLRTGYPGGGRFAPDILVRLMKDDKKARGGKVPLILARGIGESFIYPDADLSDVEAFLDSHRGHAGAK
jgi:3-dehydroquinate synthase